MPRNKETVHRRLQQAALDLFLERGYDQTTTAAIAARAGVTQRTFFRHFADKRDILFDQETHLATALTQAIASAPPHLAPIQVVLVALQAVQAIFEDQRAFVEPRSAVIAATPALNERELTKTAALTGLLASALEQRGMAGDVAMLAAQASVAAFNYAMKAWFADGSVGLNAHLEQAFALLSRLFGSSWESGGWGEAHRAQRTEEGVSTLAEGVNGLEEADVPRQTAL